MTDRSKSSVHGNQPAHPLQSLSEPLARNDKGGHTSYNGEVDIIAMVRSLQRSAGVADCFRKGRIDCDDVHCNWRCYCLGTQLEQRKPSNSPQE